MKLDDDAAAPTAALPSWRASAAQLLHPQVAVMLCLGFVAGLPILLIFSSLSLWLREAGVERATVTFFSWAALGYSFKFVWAPLVDRLRLPILGRMGRRRSWLLVAQLAVIAAIAGMASVDPAASPQALRAMAAFAVLLGFASATQDIVIDAYRIECAPTRLQALLASAYIAGYRVGMIVAGAGALFLAAAWGSSAQHYDYQAWRWTYLCMAAAMSLGVLTTAVVREPQAQARGAGDLGHSAQLVLAFAASVAVFVLAFVALGDWAADWGWPSQGPWSALAWASLRLGLGVAAAALAAWALVRLGLVQRQVVEQTWLAPVADFFARYGARTAWLLLALIGLYRISDIVLGVISNVFYQDIGFSKPQIAAAVKTFGVAVAIAGGFAGGLVASRLGVMRALMWGAVLSALTNLLFVVLAHAGSDVVWLYAVVAADNLAAGLASAAFVAFLSSLTQVSFTAVQYAIFSSLMTLLPKVLGGYSGAMVDALGYPGFFVLTTVMGLPVLALIVWADRRLASAAAP